MIGVETIRVGMEIERRALYNLMRMNWLADQSVTAEPWQVEDYRALSSEALFHRLKAHDISLQRHDFAAFASEVDTPEELTDLLLEGSGADVVEQDQVYLLVFELWRRLIGDRPSLSIFCDELDHQIYLYDNHLTDSSEEIQDAITHLQMILDENCDRGSQPKEIFQMISSACANDLETFLYDYISERLAEGNSRYAAELLEGFFPYVRDTKWFSFLRVELQSEIEGRLPQDHLQELIADYGKESDPEFYLEILTLMVQEGRQELFTSLVQKTLPLLRVEEEFRSLLFICSDFLHLRDKEKREEEVRKILTKRSHFASDSLLKKKRSSFSRINCHTCRISRESSIYDNNIGLRLYL